MELIVGVAYVILSYWAAGQTIYTNKIRSGHMADLFFICLIAGLPLGIILMPIILGAANRSSLVGFTSRLWEMGERTSEVYPVAQERDLGKIVGNSD